MLYGETEVHRTFFITEDKEIIHPPTTISVTDFQYTINPQPPQNDRETKQQYYYQQCHKELYKNKFS